MPEPADRAPADLPESGGPLRRPSPPGDAMSDRADTRSALMAADIAALITAVWLMISPAIFNYETPANPAICGLILLVLVVLRTIFGVARRAALLAGLVLAAWLVASAFLLDESTAEAWNLGLTGLIVAMLAIVALAAREARR